jgi:Carboxypeptidase regulatory-like domain
MTKSTFRRFASLVWAGSLLAAHFFVLTIAMLLWSASPVSAQVLYGSMVGTIADQTRAVVPTAAVTATNEATGLVRTAESTADGSYSIPSVVPGVYTIEVKASGFRTFRRTGVEVTINTVTRVDVELQVGQATESVEVSGQAAVLQTDKSDVHVEISSREVTNLPISGYRNYQSLINLVPGSSPAYYQNAVIGSPGRALGTNINGTVNSNNNTRLDGASNMRASLPHQVLYIPPVEAIESVNIATNSFDADQGFAGGAAVTVSTKSGTNDLHGVLFEHHSNSRFFAKNFFYPAGEALPKNIINIFGGTIGGPIVRNKLFFFGSYEGMRERTTLTRLLTVSTAAVKAGDFSATGTTIYDPQTGNPDGSGRLPFPENKIPLARQNAITRKMQSLLPEPNMSGNVSNYFASASSVFDRDNYDVKIDWNASAKTNVRGKYSVMRGHVLSAPALGEAGGEGLINGGGTGSGDVKAQVVTGGIVHIFTPTLILDATVAYSHDPLTLIGHDYGKHLGLEFLGIPGTNGTDIRQSGMPRFEVTGYAPFGQVDPWSPKFVDNNYWTQTINMNWNRGSHQMRFGADITYNSVNQWHPERGSGPRGAFAFGGGVTALRGGASPNQYNAWAQFLLGLPNYMGKSVQTYDSTPRQWLEGFYFRDRWQATRNLTLTLGLRWEYYPLMTRKDTGIERYDPETNKVYIGGLGFVPKNVGITTSKKLFAPRLGFAYRVQQKMVIRGGYGISIDPYQFPTAESLLFPYPTIIAQDFNAANSFTYYAPIESGIPAVSPPDLSSGIIDLPPNVGTVTLENGLYRRGYVQSFNFTIERELPGELIGSVGYVATRTIRQPVDRDINAAPINGGNDGRPYAAKFGRRTATTVMTPSESASFDSLQARLDRRVGTGLVLKAAYTWSKAINSVDGSAGSLMWNHPEVFARNRALAGYDRTHNLRLAGFYDLPFGAGKPFANQSAVARAVLGGWQISGIFSAYSGTPFTVSASGASLNSPGNAQTADQIKPEVEKLGGIGPNVPFYDPLAFAAITTPRYGTSGRNILRGPGTVNLDATLTRAFRLTEKWQLQFRAECYNVTNTPSFNNPNTNVSNMRVVNGVITDLGNFMSVTSARNRSGSIEGGERAFRFALRLSF